MWHKFNWRLFLHIYLILAAVSFCCFLIGMGCDESPNPGIYCKIIIAILTFSYFAAGSVLDAALDFIKLDLGIFVVVVSWAIHAFVYTTAITFIKKKIGGWKFVQ